MTMKCNPLSNETIKQTGQNLVNQNVCKNTKTYESCLGCCTKTLLSNDKSKQSYLTAPTVQTLTTCNLICSNKRQFVPKK